MDVETAKQLIISVPTAAAVIVMASMHIKRHRESQQLGHEVAKHIQAEAKEQMQKVCESHERVVGILVDTFKESVNRLEKAIEKIGGQ